MKLTGWMKTTFAGVLSIGVLSSSAAAQDAPQEPTREVHVVTASTPRERQIEVALSAAPTELLDHEVVIERKAPNGESDDAEKDSESSCRDLHIAARRLQVRGNLDSCGHRSAGIVHSRYKAANCFENASTSCVLRT